MRPAEVRGLTWDQVDFLANTITLRAGQTKNDHGRIIPIVPQLRVLLEQQHAKRQAECPFVCWRLDRKGHPVRMKGFRKVWQSCCIKLGLGSMEPEVDPVTGETVYEKPRKDRPKAKPRAKMVYRGMLYHDLRRSCVRNLLRAGVPEKVAMQVSGHLNRQVFERHNISSDRDVLEAGQKLASYLEKVGDDSGTALHQNAAGTSRMQ